MLLQHCCSGMLDALLMQVAPHCMAHCKSAPAVGSCAVLGAQHARRGVWIPAGDHTREGWAATAWAGPWRAACSDHEGQAIDTRWTPLPSAAFLWCVARLPRCGLPQLDSLAGSIQGATHPGRLGIAAMPRVRLQGNAVHLQARFWPLMAGSGFVASSRAA